MNQDFTQNTMISKILFILGWVLNFSGWIAEADLILSFVLKITSLISFVIFLIINLPKVKRVLRDAKIRGAKQ